jgi:alpha-L-fucosidase 2
VLSDLNALTGCSYADIRERHLSDYQSYFNRTSLDLGQSSALQRSGTTTQRLSALANGTFDPELAALYFQFGRYLLISTSRNNTLPPNLQGIWNSDLDPQWGKQRDERRPVYES